VAFQKQNGLIAKHIELQHDKSLYIVYKLFTQCGVDDITVHMQVLAIISLGQRLHSALSVLNRISM
jgi:hypothetical protein